MLFPRISIHALVKRATKTTYTKNQAVKISIHALVKRATDMIPALIDLLDISIHALVKRATDLSEDRHPMRGFQSTPS